jgi:flagellar protein FlaI
MTNPPIDVPEAVMSAVDLNVVMFRDRRRNFRRVLEIAEIEEEDGLKPHTIYNWNSQEDSFSKEDSSRKIIDKLSLLTGMSEQDIEENLEEKISILEWMIEEDINDLDKVGKVVAEYYSDRDLVGKIREGVSSGDVLGDE